MDDVYLDLLPLLEKVARDSRSNHGNRLLGVGGPSMDAPRMGTTFSMCLEKSMFREAAAAAGLQPLNACDGARAHPRPWIHEHPDRPS